MSKSTNRNARRSPGVWQWLTEIGNYDFCPWANNYVYWLKQPIGWFLVAAACSLLVGLFLGPQGYIFLAAILAVTLLGVIWPWVAMRGIRCELRFDRSRVNEGDTATVILKVINRSMFPVWGLTVSRGMDRTTATEADKSGDQSTFMGLRCVAPWSETEFEWPFQPQMRGEYPTQAPLVGNGFPFGLWSCFRTVEVVSKLLVWPRTWSLAALPNINGNVNSLLGALSQSPGTEGEVLGLRPFRRGDSMKSVHWPQTARQGELVVRERQSNRRREIQIVIDTTPTHHVGTGYHASLEWVFRVAASMCKEFHTQGFQVECRLAGESIVAPVQTSGIKPILDRLANYDTSPESVGGAAAGFSAVANGSTAERRVFVVTTDRNRLAPQQIDTTTKMSAAGWIVLDTTELEEMVRENGAIDQMPSAFRVMTRKYAIQTPFVAYSGGLVPEAMYESQG